MRIPRIYQDQQLELKKELLLDNGASNHISRVLRMKDGELIELFNGDKKNYIAVIVVSSKSNTQVRILSFSENLTESKLNIHLGQVISRGDKMEFTIQKAVELGVNSITPLISERCGVKLDVQRMQKKIEQWQKIAISASEQSGRSVVPKILEALDLDVWCAQKDDALGLNLAPKATTSIDKLLLTTNKIRLLIGPEGGLSASEITLTEQFDFEQIVLGPRILRTETAALVAISALQFKWGDLN